MAIKVAYDHHDPEVVAFTSNNDNKNNNDDDYNYYSDSSASSSYDSSSSSEGELPLLVGEQQEPTAEHTKKLLAVQQDSKKQNKQQKKKRVRFAESVIRVEDDDTITYVLTEEQKGQMWFTPQEFQVLHSQLRTYIQKNLHNKSFDKRGLEGLLMNNQLAISATRKLILKKQEEQKKQQTPSSIRRRGSSSKGGLGALSCRLTRHDVYVSVARAAQDALEANRIYKETMNAKQVDLCFL